MGRVLEIPSAVSRIVSIVPSQTELLVDLGVKDRLVGVTKFCIHPRGLKQEVATVGGTKTLQIERIRALKPDLIIGNKEENSQSDIEILQEEFPVWMSDISDLSGALEMIFFLGVLTQTEERAASILRQVRSDFDALRNDFQQVSLSTLYLIWRKPYMAAGKNTFIDDCLQHLGLQNCLSESRYPEVDVVSVDPSVILLSSEPYPFQQQHARELEVLFPKAKIVLVDGEYFSWYGSRMLGAAAYFRGLMNMLY